MPFSIEVRTDDGHYIKADFEHGDLWLIKYVANKIKSGQATVKITRTFTTVKREEL